ncbi:hypothetical protein [Desulfobulbus propionicus]
MKKSILTASLALILTLHLPALADEGKDESGKGKDRQEYRVDQDSWKRGHTGKDEYRKEKDRKEYRRDKEKHAHDSSKDQPDRRRSYLHDHGYSRLNIPPGHYPPPGECRLWYPDRPAGHQPPPFQCGNPVPRGAWLIQNPGDVPNHVRVTAYDLAVPGRILEVGEYDIGTGGLIRVLVDF